MSEIYRPNDPNTLIIRESMTDNIKSLGFECNAPQKFENRGNLSWTTSDLPFNPHRSETVKILESYSGNGQSQNDFRFKFSVLKEYTNECLTEIVRKMGQERRVDPVTSPYFNDELGIYDNCRRYVDGLATLGGEKPEVVEKMLLDYYLSPTDKVADKKSDLDVFLEANYGFKDIDALRKIAPNASMLDLSMMEYILNYNGPLLEQRDQDKYKKSSRHDSPFGLWFPGSGKIRVFPENITGTTKKNAMRDGLLTALSGGLGMAMSPTMAVLAPIGVGSTLLALRARKYIEKKPELEAFRKEILGHEVVHEMGFSTRSSKVESGDVRAKTGLKMYYQK